MSEGSKNSGNSASKVETVGYVGLIYHVPVNTTVTCKRSGGGGGGEGSYENKSQISYGNKQTGSYGRATTKEKASGGEFYYKNGTSGVKNEYKTSSTVRVGDKSGYVEVYKEERVRNVSYDKKSVSNNLITYDNGDEGYGGSGYAGSGCDYDSEGYGGSGYGSSGCGYDYDSDY